MTTFRVICPVAGLGLVRRWALGVRDSAEFGEGLIYAV